ncbi:DNA (cytosine-5-)-methyltransferase [Clostridium thermobutyricum]|uniref:DNA (cytosine-5-)-methyltransferase n=1 Tax=Clostridium thermobutyricum TaxID=29372 RepID=UPI0018A91096|nr:DNA (cytosine-5-)-methyltransferase [Clostridium thermobutyricum]
MEKTVVELFAGVGGFRVGFQNTKSEWNFVFANQWEPSRKAQDAFNCYVNHFGISDIHSNEDIHKINKVNLPEHSLLVGGFPCQDYSVAATGAKGIQGKKGVLWWDIYDIVKVKKPPFILLENVDRLLKSPSSQRGRDFGIILACLAKENYSVEWRVINAAEYGFGQRRRRIFIFAYKNNTIYGRNADSISLRDRVLKNGFFQKGFPIQEEAIKEGVGEFITGEILEISNIFKFEFFNSGIMNNGHIYTAEVKPNYSDKQIVLGDLIENEVDKKYFLTSDLEDWKYMKGAKKIERVSKTGHKYTFSEGQIAFPDYLDRPARTMLTSEASKNRSTHIIRDPKTGELRKLTPIECERINGFPDNWTNTGMSERFRYFCMGNALVVGLITVMGNIISDIIDNEI